MNKIKVIELLNMISKGEEVPKKIKFCFRTFEYNGIDDYLCIDKNDYSKEDYCNGYSIHKWIFGNNLNDEVEIIEEKKIPEKLKDILRIDDLIPPVDENMYRIWKQVIKNYNKLNEICDYLESKGE